MLNFGGMFIVLMRFMIKSPNNYCATFVILEYSALFQFFFKAFFVVLQNVSRDKGIKTFRMNVLCMNHLVFK